MPKIRRRVGVKISIFMKTNHLLLAVSIFIFYACDYTNVEKPDGTGGDSTLNDVTPAFPIAEVIDMGTSVHWASYNIGDTSEYTANCCFGWGDPVGSMETSASLDYFPCPFPPTNISNSKYDIATQQWGKHWRLPQSTEFVELWNKSNVSIGEVYGVTYYKFTSKTTGNTLYFPTKTNHQSLCYWTGQLYENDTRCAISIFLDPSVSNPIYSWMYVPRNEFCYVRPVYEYALVWTNPANNITGHSVTLNGTLSWSTYQNLDSAGFYLSDSELELTNLNNQVIKKEAEVVGKNITTSIDDLLRNHKYYYRAYVIINNEIHLGEINSFNTLNAYEIGDLYPDNDNPIGVVCDINYSGISGKIVSLDQTTLAWQTGLPSYVSANDSGDGSKNTLPRGSAFATWIYSHGSDWYCPARYELTTLSKSIQQINSTLKQIGAAPISNFYWSSTQYSAEYYDLAYVVVVTDQTSFAGYSNGSSFYNSKNQERGVIAMRKF